MPPASIRERCSIRGLFVILRRRGAAFDQCRGICRLLRHRDGRLGPPGLGAFRDNLAADDLVRVVGFPDGVEKVARGSDLEVVATADAGCRGRCPRWCRSATGRRAGRGDGPPWIAAAWPAAVRTISRNTPTSFTAYWRTSSSTSWAAMPGFPIAASWPSIARPSVAWSSTASCPLISAANLLPAGHRRDASSDGQPADGGGHRGQQGAGGAWTWERWSAIGSSRRPCW